MTIARGARGRGAEQLDRRAVAEERRAVVVEPRRRDARGIEVEGDEIAAAAASGARERAADVAVADDEASASTVWLTAAAVAAVARCAQLPPSPTSASSIRSATHPATSPSRGVSDIEMITDAVSSLPSSSGSTPRSLASLKTTKANSPPPASRSATLPPRRAADAGPPRRAWRLGDDERDDPHAERRPLAEHELRVEVGARRHEEDAEEDPLERPMSGSARNLLPASNTPAAKAPGRRVRAPRPRVPSRPPPAASPPQRLGRAR